ncbi:MAG TPA: hypothetical protein VMH30_11110 [Verrucomicrobiae bacterium]|nr:hypothetical protein [Verrucomicrobiae bacterium]
MVTQRQFYDWQTAGGGGDVSPLVAGRDVHVACCQGHAFPLF